MPHGADRILQSCLKPAWNAFVPCPACLALDGSFEILHGDKDIVGFRHSSASCRALAFDAEPGYQPCLRHPLTLLLYAIRVCT